MNSVNKKYEDFHIFLAMAPSQRLKHVRKLLGLTQEKLAKSMGLKRDHIASIESGKVKISILHALSFEYIHKIKKEWLLEGKGSVFIESLEELESSSLPILKGKDVMVRFKNPEKGLLNTSHLLGIEQTSDDLYEKVSEYLKATHDAAKTIKDEEIKKTS